LAKRRYTRLILVFECSYVILVALLVAGVHFGIPKGGEGNLPAWVLLFATVPLSYPLLAAGVSTPTEFLLGSPIGRLALFVFYAVVVAALAVLARRGLGGGGTGEHR
jgi:hypothetical protein